MSLFSSSKGPGFWRGLRWRPSTWLSVTAGLLYLLQLSPFPGMYIVVLLGGGFTAGTLFLLAILSFLVEALLGLIPRVLAILPVGLIAGYYAILVLEYQQLSKIADALELGTQEAAAPYDPDQHLLDDAPVDLLVRYEVPEIYDSKTGKLRILAGTRQCPFVGTPEVKGAPTYGSQVRSLRKSFCFANKAAVINGREILNVVEHKELVKVDGLEAIVTSRTVGSGETKAAETRRAMAYLLPPIPSLYLGCFINDGRSSWECSVELRRQYVAVEQLDTTVTSMDRFGLEHAQFIADLATMLSLSPRPDDEIEAMVRLADGGA